MFVPSPNRYALRCPRDPDHVSFTGVMHMRVLQTVIVDFECNVVDREPAQCVEVIHDAMDGWTPLCSRCGAPAMIGRPPESVIEEDIPF